MKFRWTIKDLEENSDAVMLRAIVSERMSDLNHYSPLNNRLRQLYNKLDEQVKKEQTTA